MCTVAPGTLGAFGPPLRTPLTLTSLLHPTLSAGTEYWVTVRDPAPTELDAWNANNTFDPSSEAFSSDGGQTWTVPSGNDPGAYEVNGALVATAAPEPGSLALVCGGTLTLLCGRWKRLLRKAGTK